MKKKNRKYSILTFVLIFIVSVFGYVEVDFDNLLESLNDLIDDNEESVEIIDKDTSSVEVSSDLKIYFIDVGQADCILIQNNGENMLIDAGNNSDGNKLVNYFKSLGISKFKYLVGTHPHEDHIGGLDNVIREFDFDKLFMPDVVTTTTTYSSILDELEVKNKKVTIPKIGSTYKLGEAEFEIIYTGTNESDLNSSSIVIKLTFGSTSYLFTGDLEENVEKTLLDKDIDVDVLKAGHHGSSTSSSNEFLDVVTPKYVIISVGKNNDYGHPHVETLNRFKNIGAEVYRTDKLGTILLQSDGKNIEITNFKTDTNGG